MSSGGTTVVSPPEPQTFKRAIRKIKCAAMVSSLAKSWQGWAVDHAEKQDAIPSGWMPSSIKEEDQNDCKDTVKLTVTPRVMAKDAADTTASKIRTCSVTKTIQPKCCGFSCSELVDAINSKMESSPEESNQYLGNESLKSSRSSSVDTEDSGLGEEAGLSSSSESNLSYIKTKKQTNRPKIKIATMNDIRGRWQQWSEQHIEGQKLNPFSEEFDQEFAMAQRLCKGDTGYGRPKDGSKTAERGDRAQRHIHREMEEMVWIIRDMGIKDKKGHCVITFGRLFDRYVKISDKVVGILLRCRKHNMLDFKGEMLWKGQDDGVIITLRD
ncbi:actin-binding Rho-activating protein [Solea solea]|uniref:actin-binding Rho-activating protein n=1 Tax=Solea solea TaxID=90069 RepID=UPI00272A813E|nr:actin-binding Rho-activating protein [Solea solea]